MSNQLVMYEEELQQINSVCEQLQRDANARAVLVIDKNGQAIATAGEVAELDITSLSSLIAGNIAAAGGIAALLSEKEFAGQFHEGEKTKIVYVVVDGRVVLVVLFDDRSSLGLVRLRVRKASTELTRILADLVRKSSATSSTVLAEITDDDIDNLFND
jgi:predicted regulator of Ras-like GTPase activity (Roadblock/LC7/MglB family)